MAHAFATAWKTTRPVAQKALPAMVLLISACTVGPDFERPQLALPEAWEAPLPTGAPLTDPATWWQRLQDPALTELQQRAEKYSPTLEQAVARIEIARATLGASRAQGSPTLTSNASTVVGGGLFDTADGSEAQIESDGLQGSLNAGWEIDLFGKVRRNNQAAGARVESREYDWADGRISLLAEVADEYVQLRGCEQLATIYRQQSESQSQSARLTRISADAGFTPPADAELAEAAAANVAASLTDQRARCDLLVKSLVSLSGMSEGEARALLAPGSETLPRPAELSVTTVPADLVRQRPDVASSERELAAASAEIGAAIADLYPSLSLGGTLSVGGALDQWSFGPQLSLPLFDGGQRQANVDSAHASYDLQYGAYRETVRNAVLEVEQALVRLDSARAREDDLVRSASGYQANYRAIQELYRAGSTSIVERESARRNALDAQRALVDLRTTLLREWIALYRSLGGGWEVPEGLASANVAEGLQN